MRLVSLAVLALLLSSAAVAQDRLTTFVDCPGYVPGCDTDFFQTEIGFARFVRDPADAAVYVLVVRENTGGGGDRYTLLFEGRSPRLAGRRDTLVATSPPAASDDDQRRTLLSRLAVGLAGFASRTGLADRLAVTYAAPEVEEAEADEVVDPWNSWVFRVNGNGFANGQSQSLFYNVNGSFQARRVTEALKVSIRPRISYNRQEFELSDGSTFVSDNANYGLNSSAVAAVTDHWSVGGKADLSRSTFSNYDVRFQGGPAVEYNVYPYAESTQRQLRFLYAAGVEAVAYQDTTIFLETSAVLPIHSLVAAAEFAQSWGSVDIFSEASQYLSRPDKYNLSIGGGIDLRLFRGLNLRLNGNYSFVRDQINLPAQRADDGEILTGDQELPTGFNFFASAGISYSFGSIYNQVVNARFGN
ncbi:hypothetical protein [Rubrivirga sp. IMCC45206]|uniref:hypothetical protein n=1 Tax=Rubrivirga sp. IMCC45206 TaxID=3391614 RepID=UPI00398FDDDF